MRVSLDMPLSVVLFAWMLHRQSRKANYRAVVTEQIMANVGDVEVIVLRENIKDNLISRIARMFLVAYINSEIAAYKKLRAANISTVFYIIKGE